MPAESFTVYRKFVLTGPPELQNKPPQEIDEANQRAHDQILGITKDIESIVNEHLPDGYTCRIYTY